MICIAGVGGKTLVGRETGYVASRSVHRSSASAAALRSLSGTATWTNRSITHRITTANRRAAARRPVAGAWLRAPCSSNAKLFSGMAEPLAALYFLAFVYSFSKQPEIE